MLMNFMCFFHGIASSRYIIWLQGSKFPKYCKPSRINWFAKFHSPQLLTFLERALVSGKHIFVEIFLVNC